MSGARRSGPHAPTVSIVPGAHAPAAGVATVQIHARNVAPCPRTLQVAIVGLDDGWLPAPTQVEVSPDETVTVELPVTPTEGAVAGNYPFLVTVESIDRDGSLDRTLADASLRVDGASDLVLAVEPTDARGRRRRRVEVVVGNTGVTPVEVALASTADPALRIRLDSEQLRLRPAETVRVPARVGPRNIRLAGARTRHSYEVIATGQAAPRRAQATFTSAALLSAGAMRATAVVAVAAVWLAGLLIALPYVADRFSAEEAPTVAASEDASATQASEGDGSDGDSSSGNSDSAGDGGPDGSAEGTGSDAGDDAGEAGLRISGVITGTAPDDAAVEVVPTASLWPSSTPAEAGRQPGAAPGKMIVPAAPTAPPGIAQRLTTRADAHGAWALSGLSPTARYLVTVTKPGYSTQRVVMTGAELADAPLETDLQAGDGSMSGTVEGPDGPVGGAEITLTDGTTTITTRSATTGTVGSWQVDGLVTPSTYLVEASSPDLGTEAELVTLPASGARQADLTLEAGVASLSGWVTGTNSLGEDSGLGGITVTATDGTTTRTATTVTGESAGGFLLPRLPAPATYTVTIAGEGYTTVTRDVTLTTDGVSGWTIPMSSSGGVVHGAVTDDAAVGITGAGLTLTHGSDTTAVYKTMSASDGSGTFRFSGVDAGTYVLSAESFGHETGYAEVVVHPGGSVEVDLTLPTLVGDGLVATSSITGRVTDLTTGGPITCPMLPPGEDCQVTAEVTAVDIDDQTHLLTATADAGAEYTLPQDSDTVTGLLPGRYVVTITAPGYEPGEVEVTVPMGTEVRAETVALIPSPSLIGSVQARTGVLPDGVCVIAQSVGEPDAVEDPCDPADSACETTTSRCALVSDGSYRMDRLEAGRYQVTLAGLPDGYVTPEPERVTLITGEVQRHDFLIERNGIISATVLRSDGSSRGPAEGAWVHAVPADDSAETVAVQVGTDGFVQLTDLSPGTYTVIGSETQDGEALATSEVIIGLNQEIRIQLVLASTDAMVQTSVLYQPSPAHEVPVANARITIIGVARYMGTAPIVGTWAVETDDGGTATICTDAAPHCDVTIPIVEDTVTMIVQADGFDEVVRTDEPLSSLQRIVLTPHAQEFTGTVDLDPASELAEDTRFEVLDAPPGTGEVSLQSGPDGTVTFSDTGASGPNLIRPGGYEIRASLDGHSSSTVTFTVPLTSADEPVPEPRWQLLKDARVRVAAVDDATGDPVAGAVMTLRDPDGDLELERTAGPTQRIIDFGSLPAGDYQMDIRIAGYEHPDSRDITLVPGQSERVDVPVRRLGTIAGEVVTVLDDDWTEALPGAAVTAAGDATFTTISADDGSFAVTGTVDEPGLLDGSWRVSAQAEQHDPATTDVEVLGGAANVNPVLGLQPRPADLVVTVTDGADPVVAPLDTTLVYSTPHGVETIDACAEGTDDCETGEGTFHFRALLPTSYTLFVSGSGYMPLSTPVTMEAGQSRQLRVPISAPTGSIQGQVLRTLPNGSTEPVNGAQDDLSVLLMSDEDDRRIDIGDEGTYLIDNIDAGIHRVVVQEESAGTWTDVTPVRTVSVLAGQSAVLDLTIPLITRQVQVSLISTNETDLTGALVTLTGTVEGEDLIYGPQPVTRNGRHQYVVTFQQVPVGTWTATVSGPAGHHGSYTSGDIEVDNGDGAVTASMGIAETELRLRVAPFDGPLTPPARVTVTASPNGGEGVEAVTTTLIPGASDTVIYVPAVGWDLDATIDDDPGWSATTVPGAIAHGTASERAEIHLNAPDIATSTNISLSVEEAVVGTVVQATVTTSAADDSLPAPPEVTVELSRRTAGEDAWTALDSAVRVTDGTAVFDIVTSGWEAGAHEIRATVTAPEGWTGSSDTRVLTLTESGSGSDSDSDSGSDSGSGSDSDNDSGSGSDSSSQGSDDGP